MKTAREVIAVSFSNAVDPFCDDIDPADFADEIIRMLNESGFVILPKEPTEGMIEAGKNADRLWWSSEDESNPTAEIYKAMLQAYSKNGEGE